MFADLNEKLSGVFKRLKGEARISEANIAEAVKQVRMALLEADVNYKVVKSFVSGVQEAALGESVIKSISPAQQFIKIVHDNLVDILGGKDYEPSLPLQPIPPTIIMLSGLQGSGKTTSAGKLGRYFAKDGKNVLLIAADIYRPAAIDQLEVLGKNLNIDVYSDKSSKDAVKIMYIQYNDQKASAGEGFTLDYEYMQRWGVQYNELTKKADFCVDVQGDSMEPRFYDGDTLLIRRQPAVDVGEIGLFILDDKGYVKKWGGDRLISLNPAYEDIEIEENSRLDCAGKVLGVLDPDWIIET